MMLNSDGDGGGRPFSWQFSTIADFFVRSLMLSYPFPESALLFTGVSRVIVPFTLIEVDDVATVFFFHLILH